jgi:hypothetical protein
MPPKKQIGTGKKKDAGAKKAAGKSATKGSGVKAGRLSPTSLSHTIPPFTLHTAHLRLSLVIQRVTVMLLCCDV